MYLYLLCICVWLHNLRASLYEISFCFPPRPIFPFSHTASSLVGRASSSPFISALRAFFFAASAYPVNECPAARSHFASPRLLEFLPPAFRRSPTPLFIRVLTRAIRLLTKCFFSLKTRDIQYPARAKQSASGSAVRLNYLAASQVVDAG